MQVSIWAESIKRTATSCCVGVRQLLILFSVSFLLAGPISADWIHGYFAPSAGTDSINRFMVIQDYRDSTLLGRKIVRAGDVNSDGISDIIACRVGFSNIIDDTAYVYLGGRPPSGVYSQHFEGFNATLSSIGDINGDGIDDLGRFRFRIAPMRFEVFLGGPLLSDTPFASFTSTPWSTTGTNVSDLDGDGNLELALITHIDSNSVKIFQVTPLIDAIPKYTIRDTAQNFGDNLALGDFNGDGYSDLVIAAAYNRYVDPPFVKFYWGGPTFDTIPDFVIKNASPDWGRILKSIGDVNGDGYDDIGICGGANDPYGIYFGGPQIDNKLDVILSWQGPGYYLPPTSVSSGDFNHDGRPDIVLSYLGPIAYLDSYFEIFLGGPQIDSIAEVHITAVDIGGALFDMGRHIIGVGDFNGDGVDDFAFPTLSDAGCCWRARINLFAGWNSNPTDVDSGDESNTLPATFELKQNYPNPFNSSTRIDYVLPEPALVDLTVFDMQGRKVRTLLHTFQSAGEHSLDWDGTAGQKVVASGVYVYRLSVGVQSTEKKMVLLK